MGLKVCLYLQPASRGLGGAEVLAARLARLLSAEHDVEIVHHRPWLTMAGLGEFAGVSLSSLSGRAVERKQQYLWSDADGVLRRFKEPFAWGREIAGNADVTIALTHQLPPFNPAPYGVLILLFPMSSPFEQWPLAKPPYGGAKTWVSRSLYGGLYSHLWRGYQVRTSISAFTASWARRRWRIESDVLYPIVECQSEVKPKEDLIAMVGRFSVSGVSKHQLDLARAFSESPLATDYRLMCIGEARTAEESAYAQEVSDQGASVTVVKNAPRHVVDDAICRASVFWHAAGLFEDPDQNPELMEHFGMATVEAMAAGCVPIVPNRGGQAEIVEHNVSGFIVNSAAEMVVRTTELYQNPELRLKMAEHATQRAAEFGIRRFAERLQALASFLNVPQIATSELVFNRRSAST